MNVSIVLCGRLKEREFGEYARDIATRISRFAALTVHEAADEDEMFRRIGPGVVIALDAAGEERDSAGFSKLLDHARVTFVIGPADGFSPAARKRLSPTAQFVSLSKLTLPHRLCFVVLIEQIYRGFCIRNKLPYAK